MNYLIRAWYGKSKDGLYKAWTEIFEFDELSETKERADRLAEEARGADCDFDIAIYEKTNY